MSDELENRLESWEQLAREAVAEFEDARGYASSYFTWKWGYDETSRRFAETIERLASLRARPQEPGLSKDRIIRLIESRIDAEKVVERNCDIKCCNPQSDGPANHWGIEQGLLYAIEEIESLAPSGPLSDEPRENENPAVQGDWVSRRAVIDALKHKELVVRDDDDSRFDFVYLDAALLTIATLPRAAPIANECSHGRAHNITPGFTVCGDCGARGFTAEP